MEWYLDYDGKQFGPLTVTQARSYVRTNPNGLAWREGFPEWLPIKEISELQTTSSTASSPPVRSVLPPSLPTRTSDEVDYKIFGTEMQFVEVELDPGESVIAEAGAMMYKDSTVEMDTIFGDGSAKSSQGGLFDKLVGAGKRLLTGESLFMTVFTHRGAGKAKVAFGAPYPGNIIPMPLSQFGGTIICQKDSFLCAAKGVSVGIYFQRKIMTGLFGGEGFIMQKLDGDGLAFMHAGGTILERQLQSGEVLHVDTGCIVAFEPSVQFDIQKAGNIKSALFGGEGLFFAVLQGPGKIWLQSLPFSRLAGRMLAAAPQNGGNREEGSVLGKSVLGGTLLGGLGSFLGGDDE
ncbi:TIGR00266 family protein [Pelosinus sp. sgz500959]|uniref:TIGR00266 family protein n=1 Tax=Pelosinus sp. sgz500959 TaxID=3242472 RepID=UPI00366EA4B2